MSNPPSFEFDGEIPSSKSLWNRALILQSFCAEFEDFQITGKSESKDIDLLKTALSDWKSGKKQFYCGDGGTTLRFLALRLSREIGEFEISGSNRLFERPHSEVKNIFSQLGVESTMTKNALKINSTGWKFSEPLRVEGSESSQFASGLLLASLNLSQDFSFTVPKEILDYEYFRMTLEFVRSMGVDVQTRETRILVPANSKLKSTRYVVEPDMSSAFPLAALASLSGRAFFKNFPLTSLQPDFRFLEILKQTGSAIQFKSAGVEIQKNESRKPINLDILQSPDLFPVLCCYLSFCPGQSTLRGLERLKYKESHRLEKTHELLKQLGVQVGMNQETFVIEGKTHREWPTETLIFDTDHDHRLAMAASIMQWRGARVEILNPQVVEKSFSNYFEIIEASKR